MKWSQQILQLMREEGFSVEQVIERFSHPTINEKFVENLLKSQERLRGEHKTRKTTLRTKSPQVRSSYRKIWNKLKKLGGNEKLLDLLKEKSSSQLAEEWGVKSYDIRNYKRDYLMEGEKPPKFLSGHKNFYEKSKSEGRKLLEDRTTTKELRELW